MKKKIGEATCADCGYTACDVGLDKNGHPYVVCWGAECDGAQFFTFGKKPRLLSLLKTFRPLPGFDLAALRARYKLDPDPAPAADPPKPAPAPDPAPAADPPKPARAAKTIFG